MEERSELEVPSERQPEMHINPATPPTSEEATPSGPHARKFFRWVRTFSTASLDRSASESAADSQPNPDVSISTLGWGFLCLRVYGSPLPGSRPPRGIKTYYE